MASQFLARPFAALRPTAESAADVIAPPYDVVSTDEARALGADRPQSFLHISRPEIDLPAGSLPHSDAAYAQGVTTGALSGIVVDPQQQPVTGASVIAIHEPSGTTYEGVTRGDGRFSMPGMRVGGPYAVTVAFTGGGGTAFAPETQSDITVNLGVSTDLTFMVTPIAVQEAITGDTSPRN